MPCLWSESANRLNCPWLTMWTHCAGHASISCIILSQYGVTYNCLALQRLHYVVLVLLDYFNSILPGMPKFWIRQLQFVVKCVAHLVANLPKFFHISEYVRDKMHWLPVEERVKFKLLLGPRWSAFPQHTYNSCLCLLVPNRVIDCFVQLPVEIYRFLTSIYQHKNFTRCPAYRSLPLEQSFCEYLHYSR